VKLFNSRAKLSHQHENDVKALEYISPLARQNLKLLLRKDFKVLRYLQRKRLIESANILQACKEARNVSSSNAIQKEEWLEFLEHRYSSYRYNLMRRLTKATDESSANHKDQR